MKCLCLIIVLLVGWSQSESIEGFPDELPDLDDFEAIKERCDKKGGAGVYEKVKSAHKETQKCIKDIINIEKIKDEVEEAKKTGSMDEVFGKYCGKRPQIKECIKKTYDAVKPCLEQTELEALNVTGNIITKLGEFACYKDGDRIAMFVAEGGVECIKSRVEAIRDCVNQTVKFHPATFSPNSIPNLSIDKKKCDDLSTIQTCVVDDLESHCDDSTPSNIVDSLFRFVKKNVCKDIKPKRSIRSLKRTIRSMMSTTHQRFEQQMEEIIKATCEKKEEVEAYIEVMAAFNESRICLKNYRIFVTPFGAYQSGIKNCTSEARDALKSCLQKEERYYPDYLLEMTQSVSHFIYNNADKLLGSEDLNEEFADCLRTIREHSEEVQKQVIKCINQTSTSENSTKVITIPPKAEFCKKLEDMNICIENVITNKCTKDVKVTNFVKGFVEAMEAPCRNETVAMS